MQVAFLGSFPGDPFGYEFSLHGVPLRRMPVSGSQSIYKILPEWFHKLKVIPDGGYGAA
jgi:hypothetical protein